MKRKLIYFLVTLLMAWPVKANDEEIVEYLDFFENLELVEDENYKNLSEDSEELEQDKEKIKQDEENA